jgi:prepilin-type N-terminal cleavage/methylation domain-containing protein
MRKGFTLVETLVVIAILGVIILFAVPTLYRMLQNYYVKSAASQFAVQVRMTRNLAVTQKRDYRITVCSKDASSPPCSPNTYLIEYEDEGGSFITLPHVQKNIPNSIEILSGAIFLSGQATLEFDSRGKIKSTTVVATSPFLIDFQNVYTLQYRVAIDSIGSVKIEEV